MNIYIPSNEKFSRLQSTSPFSSLLVLIFNESKIMNNTLENPIKSNLEQTVIKILLGSLLLSLSLLTIFGNLLVFYAIHTEKRLRTVSNIFILSLAFADLIVGFIVMPLSAVYIILNQWPFSTFLCQIWLSIDYVAR